MERVFFTYVWGPPGDPAWPLIFSTKAARSDAREKLTEGDLVFTVCTKGEPTEPELRGRVVGVYKVSDLEVNTQDYHMPSDGVSKFPYALHPISVWQIMSADNVFSDLVGPLTPNHHLQAQSKVVELDQSTAKSLLLLERHKVNLATPKTELGRGLVSQKNSKLAPKHEGSYTGRFAEHEVWFFYMLVLRDSKNRPLALKIGYAHSPQDREIAHNSPMAVEVTGLKWNLEFKQPVSSEDSARNLEQAVLRHYAAHRLQSNGEMLREIDPNHVMLKVAELMRSTRAL